MEYILLIYITLNIENNINNIIKRIYYTNIKLFLF